MDNLLQTSTWDASNNMLDETREASFNFITCNMTNPTYSTGYVFMAATLCNELPSERKSLPADRGFL